MGPKSHSRKFAGHLVLEQKIAPLAAIQVSSCNNAKIFHQYETFSYLIWLYFDTLAVDIRA
jgi:hypothetical protein